MSTMRAFLKATEVIDWDHPLVRAKAQQLANGSGDAQEICQRCFEWDAMYRNLPDWESTTLPEA
jgi:hypothetical protein